MNFSLTKYGQQKVLNFKSFKTNILRKILKHKCLNHKIYYEIT